jgi:hypothetical protein
MRILDNIEMRCVPLLHAVATATTIRSNEVLCFCHVTVGHEKAKASCFKKVLYEHVRKCGSLLYHYVLVSIIYFPFTYYIQRSLKVDWYTNSLAGVSLLNPDTVQYFINVFHVETIFCPKLH